MSKLVHINKIELASSESLSMLVVIDESTCRFKSSAAFTEININELVGVTVEDELVNNQRVYTTTATFKSCSKIPMEARRKAFRLTSVDGQRFMIGTNARPYPIIKENNPFPEKPTDSSLKTVTITWKAPHPMLRILE